MSARRCRSTSKCFTWNICSCPGWMPSVAWSGCTGSRLYNRTHPADRRLLAPPTESPMAKIFCIANQKGGVGKTTTTVNLAAALGRIGQRVLVVDLDPQGNATMGSGVDKRALELTVYDVLLESASVAEARQRSDKAGYDVLGANRELAGAEVELVELERRDKRLKSALEAVVADYDFVLIDCPPSLSLLTLNGLCSAH